MLCSDELFETIVKPKDAPPAIGLSLLRSILIAVISIAPTEGRIGSVSTATRSHFHLAHAAMDPVTHRSDPFVLVPVVMAHAHVPLLKRWRSWLEDAQVRRSCVHERLCHAKKVRDEAVQQVQ